MTAIDLTTQRVVLTKISAPLKPGALAKPQRLLATLLQSLGFSSITIGTTAPVDLESLWYNKDTDTFRRYNPLTSTWATMVPTQWVLHLLQMGFKAAGVEGLADNADKLLFLDVSANEAKTISIADLKASLGVTGWVQYGSTQTLGAPATQIEFDLPTAFTSVLLHGTWTSTGSGTLPAPEVIGVYPTDAEFVMDTDQPSPRTFTGGSARRTRAWLDGDRSDLTGVIMFTSRIMSDPSPATESVTGNGPTMYWPANRIAKLRYRRPSGTWQFNTGSVFKLFVR